MKQVAALVAAAIVLAGGAAAQAQEAVTAKQAITIYGQIKVDTSFDSSDVNNGNFAAWVGNEKANTDLEDKALFNMHARDSRIGMKVAGPEYDDLVTKALIEFDFHGYGTENSYLPRLRHAFVEFGLVDDLSVLLGQTWDVIMPLNPMTHDYFVLWYQGNIGFRRPQIRVTKEMEVGEEAMLKLQAALTRPIGSSQTLLTVAHDSGELSGMPGVQARAGLDLPLLSDLNAQFGLNLAFGNETYINPGNGNETDYKVSLFGFDAKVPVNEEIAILGEFWSGKNVDEFLGALGQGTVGDKSVKAQGFWIASTYAVSEAWTLGLGFGMDDVDDKELGVGDPMKNTAMFANATYKFSEETQFGFEIKTNDTEYKKAVGGAAQEGDNLRLQFTCLTKF